MKRSQFISLSVMVVMGIVVCLPVFSADLTYPFPESSLSGLVRSEKGELLEGILVKAKQEGVNKALTVVSNAQGKYRFPKLEAGRYVVEIARADGMEEPRKSGVEIKSGQESRVDFQIGPAPDIEQHITGVDWIRNLPGTPEQKELLSDGCMHCHTGNLQKFRFDKESWLKIIRLMRGTNVHSMSWGQPSHAQLPGAKPTRELPGFEEKNQVLAEYLTQVRGPEPLKWDNAKTKVIPRPTGRSTRVMFTEYVIPYDNAELHDIGVDKYGMVWWTDWRSPYIGMLNPETGEMKYWESPPLPGKPEVHPGSQEIGFDKDENLWTTITWTGGLLKFDRKTEKFTTWEFPDRGQRRMMQNGMDNKRGRIWFHTDDYYGTFSAGFYVPEKKQLTLFEIPRRPGKNESFIYGIVTDSKGNTHLMKFLDSDIDRIDAETGELKRYPTPTPNAFPRRGDYDSQDRIWFAEYNANQIGVLDPKAGKITEYKLPLGPLAYPYGCGVDRINDLVWVEQYRADSYAVLDPKTGEIWEYLLPERYVMARSPVGAPGSKPGYSVMWAGTLPRWGNGKLIKIEAWYR